MIVGIRAPLHSTHVMEKALNGDGDGDDAVDDDAFTDLAMTHNNIDF